MPNRKGSNGRKRTQTRPQTINLTEVQYETLRKEALRRDEHMAVLARRWFELGMAKDLEKR
jgi:hypothetical protein